MSGPGVYEAWLTDSVAEGDGFLAFAQIHLRAAARDSFAIGDGLAP